MVEIDDDTEAEAVKEDGKASSTAQEDSEKPKG